MGVLTEYVRKEVDRIRTEMARRKELLDEWLAAISKLYDTLEGWIKEADGGLGILGIKRNFTVQEISEPRLGYYDIPVMQVTLGGAIGRREATVVPKARYVAAVIQPPGRETRRADGIVQLNQASIPGFYLFRWKSDTGDEWFIRNVNVWNATPGDHAVEPLSRDSFEAAMLWVLQ